ncbi:protein-L-isoaspartate O-methyltransferase family protein [Methylobacterium sp. J-077]|uniref:protein-L-isoaspartate O-methyltransferase family protein n=1 Tax=Methylobacterium sp. J-077 TaxID=2836656 RepID=UPI001FB8FC11|nr:methyltransferase domain-containing protein [Methylobacterium sp. J-077]MCJ2123496.1 methyltransferase domain-containing protein [Methylobacterium sp. J-077]
MVNRDGSTARSAKLRGFYASLVSNQNVASDPRIEAAFAAIAREPFAGPGPWSILAANIWRFRDDGPHYVTTPDDDPAFLYQDVLVALDAGRGINIGQPSLHAFCLDALAPQRGETVLQVGTGSGYYTALLAHLVGPDGHVHGFEIDPCLAERAARNLAPWPWARVEARSGATGGLPEADAIYVNAGAPRPARAWLDALRPEGRLLFPLQSANRRGGMLLIRRPGADAAWLARFVSRASFIPLQGLPEDDGGALLEAFAREPLFTVRSLRFGEPPDATCWYNGGDWWLSTRDP